MFRFSLQHVGGYAFPNSRDEKQSAGNKVFGSADSGGPNCGRIRRCSTCGAIINKYRTMPCGLDIERRNYDIGNSYDGVTVISDRFRRVYKEAGFQGLAIIELDSDENFYVIRSKRVINFDTVRRKTRFIDMCSVCGIYRSVVGATPVFVQNHEVLGESELAFTDVQFGSGDEKAPLLLCGDRVADRLRASPLVGVCLEQVEVGNG